MKTGNYSGIRYISFGRGSRAMVVVPGLSIGFVTDGADAIEKAFEIFAEEYTVYLFDVKEDVPEDYSLPQMADDLAAVIKGLGLNSVYLYGCSMGGMESICLAGKYPELIEKVAVAASSCKANENSDRVFTNWISLAKERKCHELTADMGQKIFSGAVYEASKDAFSAMADGLTDELLYRFINTAKVMVGADITAEAAAIKCPVLVLGSGGDRVMTVEASMKIAEITGANSYIYGDEYPHAVYDEAPDFRGRVKAFFG